VNGSANTRESGIMSCNIIHVLVSAEQTLYDYSTDLLSVIAK